MSSSILSDIFQYDTEILEEQYHKIQRKYKEKK